MTPPSLWPHLLLNSYKPVSEEAEVFSQKSRALIVLLIFFLPLRKEKGFWGVLEKVQSISVAPGTRQFTAVQLLYSQHKKSTSLPISCRQEIFLLATDIPYSSTAELCPPPEIWSGLSLWCYRHSSCSGCSAAPAPPPLSWADVWTPLCTEGYVCVGASVSHAQKPALIWLPPLHLLQGCLTIPHQQSPAVKGSSQSLLEAAGGWYSWQPKVTLLCQQQALWYFSETSHKFYSDLGQSSQRT